MQRKRAILDMVNNQLHFLGPGDFRLQDVLPPGTESFQLHSAPSGHLILPCNKFAQFDKQQMNGNLELDSAPITLVASTSDSTQ